MATYALPDLRRAQLTAGGTITVPAGETWIVKTGHFSLQKLTNDFFLTIVATINSIAYTWVKLANFNLTAAGHIWEWYSQGFITGGSVIMKAGDTIVATLTNGQNLTIDIGYYILEQDF